MVPLGLPNGPAGHRRHPCGYQCSSGGRDRSDRSPVDVHVNASSKSSRYPGMRMIQRSRGRRQQRMHIEGVRERRFRLGGGGGGLSAKFRGGSASFSTFSGLDQVVFDRT